jgi:glycosyltransferase involved in cell wall biosynthesis
MERVTVAIPVRNGGAALDETLSAVKSQEHGARSVQLLVCDSGSTDGSPALARAHGAEVVEIEPEEFSHGGTRNLLMKRAEGSHVAFLSQDATPANERWLDHLLDGFALADDVALVFGPYLPRPDASIPVARELADWFRLLSPDGGPRVDRLTVSERDLPARDLLGVRGFFTDANGCIARGAWEAVPFRPIAYAEDHVLAHDMLRAGFAKAYIPNASVIHSHEYSAWDWLRRSFDEARAMREVYGFNEPGQLRPAALRIWGRVGADLRWAAEHDRAEYSIGLAASSAWLHLMRAVGTALGTRFERLPSAAVRRLSLEGRT